jgi:hypothetical protein
MQKRGRCPAQAGKRQWLGFSLFLDFACAFLVPLFPEPGSIDFTLGALRQSGLEGLGSLRAATARGFRVSLRLRSGVDLVPGTEVIVCADREGDIYEIFAEREKRLTSGQPAASWLIRSKTNRCLEPFEEGQQEPIGPPVKSREPESRPG